jgi:hypothetical protein
MSPENLRELQRRGGFRSRRSTAPVAAENAGRSPPDPPRTRLACGKRTPLARGPGMWAVGFPSGFLILTLGPRPPQGRSEHKPPEGHSDPILPECRTVPVGLGGGSWARSAFYPSLLPPPSFAGHDGRCPRVPDGHEGSGGARPRVRRHIQWLHGGPQAHGSNRCQAASGDPHPRPVASVAWAMRRAAQADPFGVPLFLNSRGKRLTKGETK